MNRLAFFRQQAGIKAKTAARLLGIAELRLLRYERGLARPTRAELLKIARIYGVSFSVLSGAASADRAESPMWYLRRHGGQTLLFCRDQPPRPGAMALVLRGGRIVELLLTRRDIDSGEKIIAVAAQSVDEL